MRLPTTPACPAAAGTRARPLPVLLAGTRARPLPVLLPCAACSGTSHPLPLRPAPQGRRGGGRCCFECMSRCRPSTAAMPHMPAQARGQQLPLRVSAISPGIVETEFFKVRVHCLASYGAWSLQHSPRLQVRGCGLWNRAAPWWCSNAQGSWNAPHSIEAGRA